MTQAPSRGGEVACLGRGCADVTRPRRQGQAGLTPFHTRLKWNPLFRLAPPIAQVCPSGQNGRRGPCGTVTIFFHEEAGTIRPLRDGEAHARPASDIWPLFYSL